MKRRYGRWTVLGDAEPRGRMPHVSVRCDCGTKRDVSYYNLIRGQTRSCGCLQREVASQVHATHGMSSHPAYNQWKNMHQRCADHSQDYSYYAGQGIRVCKRWNSFEKFWQDMGPSWQAGLTLGRINGDKGYSPSNCRWETQQVQLLHYARNVFVETPWGRMTMKEASERSGVPYGRLLQRKRKLGWPDAELFSPKLTKWDRRGLRGTDVL